ncbi:MAG TPA: glycosyltransferase family 1 protein [Candidatus Saccharimonadia bacterium]|nr:glycosyltransferase family 1 protein [Candidatus Saccharimonadia bacterium]
MMVIFDARWTKTDHHDGISRFGANLLEALVKLTPVTALICDQRQLKLLPTGPTYIQVNQPTSPAEILLPLKLNRLDADAVYSPMQIMGTIGRRYKLIFTLHDTIYYRYPMAPTDLSVSARAFWWLYHQAYWPGRLVLNQADLIATVSEFSKHEITSNHLTDRPVEVLYNAAPKLPSAIANTKIKPELVFMGTLMPYKNAELLIQSLPLLPKYHLHLTGRATPDRLAALTALANQHHVASRITFWNGASDADYAKLLSSATALVSASRFEGFGLPLVEGMAHGVPVVCSDIPIFHEVAGKAALYFDPDSPAAFADQIRALEQPPVRAELIKLGSAQAASFSWDHTAAKLLKILTTLTAQEHK